MNRSEIKKALHRHGLAPSRQRGQNFLSDPRMAAEIVRASAISPSDTVIELGVGFGALTLPLAATATRVIGIEIDAGIVDYHRRHHSLPDNVELRHQDMLGCDLAAIAAQTGQRLKIIANLPYSVSSPLLFKLLENREVMGYAILMLQKELAERMVAVAGSKNYSILSVLFAASARVSRIMEVSPENFHPRPKVNSTVIRIDFFSSEERERLLPPHDFRELTRVVKVAFSQRRKTLINCLKAGGIISDRGQGEEILKRLGIETGIRAERLSVKQFIDLTLAVRESLVR